ncbi:hypothetical protein RHMOL_Rhmol06G0194400 [Rhododendron molle]|uniref:Uncharacterized protein n=1 Tax=Rhododendron molle TaxID=49168 RepID=A0ACC0NFN1_RHOML|nr:hypothetical protein RHMOL_Rhmol06G0194400 [Rhododendron molle]
MDTKALAKSKRAHSQHHSKKHHPNITSKAPSVGASSGKNPSGQQVREKPHQSQGSSKLPSNWDRYEEEYDSGLENPSHNNTSQAIDVMPKSKGADYGHLISEAKSQSLTDISSDGFPSFDDVLTDFNQGFGSLLSVRGQGGILSWTGDDNFVVEDRATASHESEGALALQSALECPRGHCKASFLSLNLHLLAEQLAKADLSQRLLIDPEFLPPELCSEELETSFSQEPGEGQAAFQREGVTGNSVSTSSNQELERMNQIKDEVHQSLGTSERMVQYHGAQSYGTSVANTKKKSFRVQAAASEAELDMLLESFSEANILDSSAVTKNSSDSFSVHQKETSSTSEGISSLKQVACQPSTKGPDLTKPTSVANFDDALDDLLKVTSTSETFSIQQETSTSSSVGGTSSVHSAPLSRKGSNPSKSASATASFDDALDDLLDATSNLTNRKVSLQSDEGISTHLDITSSSSSGPVSKCKVLALDDFDSWFDNIDGP